MTELTTQPKALVLEEPIEPIQDDEPVIAEGGPSSKGLTFGGWLALGWLTFLLISMVFADWLPLVQDPNTQHAGYERLAPFQTWDFPLGADANGRDMLSRAVYGARTSMFISVTAVLLGLLLGGLLGLLAGYFRNWFSAALASLFDILLAIPAMVLALSLVAVLKGDPTGSDGIRLSSQTILIIALGIVTIPILARVTRANTMAWAQRDFVTAARAQGAGDGRILFREILPNVVPAMLAITLLGIAIAVVAEGGLAILGAGVEPPTASWGQMMSTGRGDLRDAPFIVGVPVVAIFFTAAALNYLGDLISERFDVRESAL